MVVLVILTDLIVAGMMIQMVRALLLEICVVYVAVVTTVLIQTQVEKLTLEAMVALGMLPAQPIKRNVEHSMLPLTLMQCAVHV